MIETTEYAERAGLRIQTEARELTGPAARGGFWRGLDRFDWICVAALLLTFVVLSHLPLAPSKFSDIYFHEEAKQLARVIKGLDPWTEIRIARAPAPVLYYAVPYLLVPTGSAEEVYWRVAVVWNALWMLFSLLLIRRAGRFLGGDGTGKFAAALSLAVPFAAYYSFGISSEPPAYVGAVVFAYGWARWRKMTPSRLFSRASWIALAGLVALFLCRPNAIVVLGIAGACAVALWRRSSPSRLSDMRFAALCMLVGLASVFLVSLMIQHLPDKRGVKLQASNFSDVLFFGNFQFRKEPWDWRFWGKATRTGSVDYQNWVDAHNELLAESERSGVPVSKLEMGWSVGDILHHPGERLKMFAVRALALNIWIVHSQAQEHSGLGLFGRGAKVILFHLLLNAIVLMPLVASVWFLATNRGEFLAYWPLWGPWLGLLLFHSFVYAEPRYLLPGLAGETLMAACLMAKLIEGRKSISAGSGPRP